MKITRPLLFLTTLILCCSLPIAQAKTKRKPKRKAACKQGTPIETVRLAERPILNEMAAQMDGSR